MRLLIEIRDLSLAVQRRGSQGTIERAVRGHSGWISCRYKGKRYQVFGGWVVNNFIDLCNPLKGKRVESPEAEILE